MKYIKSLSIIAVIVVIAALFASCEKQDDSIIDPTLTFPKILDAFVTPQVFDTTVVNSVAVAVVTSEEPVSTVTVSVTSPETGNKLIVELRDDGVSPDTTAGDGRYSGLINFNMSCRYVGVYPCVFLAKNKSGLSSNTIQKSLQVVNSNDHLPVVSNLRIYPDSVHVNTPTFIIFSVTAIDPDGSCDIKQVYYDGFKPDNSPLERRRLYDDGSCCQIENTGLTSGDSTANDSRFIRQLYGPPDQVGYYRYYIRAVDNSDSLSSILADSIYVYQ